MVHRLETPRLELRPLELADAAETQALFPKWEIVRFLAGHVPWPYPDDGALTHYRDHALPAMERGDEWHWSLRLKSAPGQLIGSISLLKMENGNRDRKSTRLNSSHRCISYAVFCLKKK